MTWREILIQAIAGAVVGGLVGYVTNQVAIWMLFNPKRPRRLPAPLGGGRTPFTPGLLVSKQRELAASIGRTVGRDLLKPEAVIEKVKSQPITREVENAVARCVEDVADRDLPCVADLLGPEYRDHVDQLREPFKAKVRDGLKSYLSSESTRETLLSLAESECARFMERPLQRWLDTSRREALARWLVQSLRDRLRGESLDELLAGASQQLAGALSEGASAELEAVKKLAVETLRSRARDISEQTIEHLRARLREPETEVRLRRFLVEKGQRVSRRILAGYMPKTSWITASLIDMDGLVAGIINDNWRVIHEEMFRELDSGEAHEMIVEGVGDLSDQLAATPVESLLNPVEKSDLARTIRATIRDFLTHRLDFKAIEDGVYDWLTEQSRKPVETFLPEWRQVLRKHAGELLAQAPRWAEDERWGRALDGVLDEAFRALIHETRLGRPAEWISSDRRNALSAALAAQLHARVVDAAPEILERLDMPAIIEGEINKLDPAQIEKTVRGVAERELRAIIWFGGAAGVVLGAVVQPILAWAMG